MKSFVCMLENFILYYKVNVNWFYELLKEIDLEV